MQLKQKVGLVQFEHGEMHCTHTVEFAYIPGGHDPRQVLLYKANEPLQEVQLVAVWKQVRQVDWQESQAWSVELP
jgi:hypothetical protein